jgi:dGTPase
MKEQGGFEHNRHGLRIVELLEYRYADFPGLNLSWEVLEAMAQHSKRWESPELQEFAGGGQPLLEAQVVDAADSLAYDTHDIDDALSVGLVSLADLDRVEFWRRAVERVRQAHRNIGPLQFQPTVVRSLIDWQVTDLLEHTRQRLRDAKVRTVADVRQAAGPVLGPGPEVRALKTNLEEFLRSQVYRHFRIMRMAAKGQRILTMLFEAFRGTPELMPERYARRARTTSVERTVCDYLAGMTDRYAQDEYLRLFQPYSSV